MTEDAFAQAVRQLCQIYGGSVSSWGRTDARSVTVGGFEGDPHTWWYGADVVWDTPPALDVIVRAAMDLDLQLLREKSHDHLQPFGYPTGALTAAQVHAWKAAQP